MGLIFENKITGPDRFAFIEKVKSISKDLGYDPNWLMLIMNSETGGSFSASVRNPKGGAIGLIQFMPATAKWLGTSSATLAMMTRVAQLDYVKKYFQIWKKLGIVAKSYTDMYLITFYPVAVGKPDDYVIGSEKGMDYAKEVARVNPFDTNKNGVLTIKEFKQFAFRKYVQKQVPKEQWGLLEKGGITLGTIAGLAAFFLGYAI